jgi:hypothetical protein
MVTATVSEYILVALREKPSLSLDELVYACPAFAWNEVFAAVDRLSRSGLICLRLDAPGRYVVSLPGIRKEPRYATIPQAEPVPL